MQVNEIQGAKLVSYLVWEMLSLCGVILSGIVPTRPHQWVWRVFTVIIIISTFSGHIPFRVTCLAPYDKSLEGKGIGYEAAINIPLPKVLIGVWKLREERLEIHCIIETYLSVQGESREGLGKAEGKWFAWRERKDEWMAEGGGRKKPNTSVDLVEQTDAGGYMVRDGKKT